MGKTQARIDLASVAEDLGAEFATVVPDIAINPNWFKGYCPNCKLLVYIDESTRTTYHKAPICDYWNKLCSNAKCIGEVALEE